MKDNLTSIAVILDASGSMASLSKDTIGSFNTFLREQKAVPGEAVLTLALFSDRYELIHDSATLNDVPELTEANYKCSGSTALLDAIGKTVDTMGRKLASMKEEERASKILVMILTDGEENASTEYKHAKIKEMVSHQQDVYKWEFVFIGANIDSFATGTSMGVSGGHTYSYSSIPGSVNGMHAVFTNSSNSVSAYRNSVIGTSFNMADPINTVSTDTVTPAPVITGTVLPTVPGQTVSATPAKANSHSIFNWGKSKKKPHDTK